MIHIQACELGNLGGCVNVSRMYSKGEGTDKNPVAAKEWVLVMIENYLTPEFFRYGDIAAEMMAQLKEQQARLAFAEGAE